MNYTVLLRLPAIKARTARSRSSTYADIKAGLFVSPVSIGVRAVAWPENEVEEIITARIAGKSDDEIRQLVAKLESARRGGPK